MVHRVEQFSGLELRRKYNFAGIGDGVVSQWHRHSCLCSLGVQPGALQAVAVHQVVDHLAGGVGGKGFALRQPVAFTMRCCGGRILEAG